MSTKTSKKPPLGSGERYEQMIARLSARGVKDPKALAAFIGRKKLGKAKFQKLAAEGRRRAAAKRKSHG